MNSERCSQCKHFIIANAGEGKIYGCDRSKCVFEPTTKNDLGVQMTNGEKMQEIFPEGKTRKCRDGVVLESDGWCHAYDSDWWNAEYKEPTTKNCESCRYYGSHHEVCNYCYKCSLWTEVEPTTKNDLGVDLISRADLYNRIKGIDHDEDYECDEFGGSRITYHTCDWDEVLREIEDAPSVTPQATGKGRWLAIPTKDGTHEMTCSCCGYVVVELVRRRITEETALEYLKDRIDENKFCPYCGADMREVEE